mmetsp:Transcript_8719/g.22541  ORF Transcript_8719/g.22541 Transcript_8719/m.22541 type:complete len:102 (-) Transcript_8719:942-1247(-)
MLKRLTAALSKKDKDVHILVLGLDNSGKSSLIQHIKPKKYQEKAATYEATPTVGFQTDKFHVNNLAITCFDMSGQSRYRSLWEHYYVQVEAIIFVVDSTDR